MHDDPHHAAAIHRVRQLVRRAQQRGAEEPTAAALATADPQGRPSIRMVLLKDIDLNGVVFYTNLKSRKGRELAANAQAALCWFSERLRRQVVIEGRVESVTAREADAYWASRPRATQLGAWASLQSQPLGHRTALLARVAAYQVKFAGRAVPRPPHWSGFRVRPDRIEFWRARPFRLNERLVYQRSSGRWTAHLLYP